MKASFLFAIVLLAVASSAAAQSVPVIDNPNVTVWNVPAAEVAATRATAGHDAVLVYIGPESAWGKVDFVPQGGDPAPRVSAANASRVVVIALKAPPAPALPNRSGFPDAFPRAGKLARPLDNAKVMVWDFSFETGKASEMHFHPRDVVTIYLKDGQLVSTTPEGTKTDNVFSYGTIRFNPRNRTHTETVMRGESRIIAVELK